MKPTLPVYTDQANLFRTDRPQQRDEELEGRLPKAQIERALEELGVEWVAAHSPQAKGRVERFFGTAQDRLVKGLRKAGGNSLEAAQQYLQTVFLPLWNRRFPVTAANPTDAHRVLRPEHNLAAILCHVESRVVAADYTLRFHGRTYQIARNAIGPGLREARVRLEKRRDGRLGVRFRDRCLPVSRCEPKPMPAAPARSTPPARLRESLSGVAGWRVSICSRANRCGPSCGRSKAGSLPDRHRNFLLCRM